MPACDSIWHRAVLAALCVSIARATDCYYPNGKVSPNANDQPCSTAEGSACCPENWQCLDNGLCYYPPEDYYGRYGCTDKTWGSPLCPSNVCTHDLTAVGDEALLQCSNHNDQWCCDGDGTHVHCCTDDNIQYFDMPEGKAYATVGGGSTPSSAPTVNTFGPASSSVTSSPSPPSSSSSQHASAAASSEASSSSTPKSSSKAAGMTSVRTSISSGSSGVATVFITIPPSSAPTTTTSSTSGKGSHTGLIIGCAVGVPVGLALIGLLTFFLLRRRKTGAATAPGADGRSGTVNSASEIYKSEMAPAEYGPAPSELAGNPIGTARPVSMLPGKAELVGEGTLMRPSSESGGTAPPGYEAAEGMGGANVTQGGRYVPYRPSMERVQEAPVELPARDVRTPPA
ncbi:uncharacterized protein BDZ99DRAFT_411296 [Mytilinidion resinicola]|uniref:Mid2 domain-containing protein n=1 Tax=Mytilinidion resinicola TaxID=574789 RepID=A0A6A6YWL6_9PEZI|nr:uncharacterized protein BDZ99DRAFT_411296 [Mytilinidion resinicola]KAF2812948.1 hypothetical protein BDZ99DRAFT_411296 [Mytilinidion resinicola]